MVTKQQDKIEKNKHNWMKGFYIEEEKQIEYAVDYLLLLSPHYPFLSHEYTHDAASY
jgi:hypothetical protein